MSTSIEFRIGMLSENIRRATEIVKILRAARKPMTMPTIMMRLPTELRNAGYTMNFVYARKIVTRELMKQHHGQILIYRADSDADQKIKACEEELKELLERSVRRQEQQAKAAQKKAELEARRKAKAEARAKKEAAMTAEELAKAKRQAQQARDRSRRGLLREKENVRLANRVVKDPFQDLLRAMAGGADLPEGDEIDIKVKAEAVSYRTNIFA